MAELPENDYDGQDGAEVFDEDNTNTEADRYTGREDAEQLEDLPDVYDVTSAVGDADDDEAVIGEDLDDEDIVALASDNDDDDDELEDDDLASRDGEQFQPESDLYGVADAEAEDSDDIDGLDRLGVGEVELEYAGDLNDLEGATSSAADMESDTLSDEDLRELDYKEG